MKSSPDHAQTMQRIKVGIIGLAAVLLLIGIASAIIGSATRGGVTANDMGQVALNDTLGNAASGEPLAELGAMPGTGNEQAAGPR